MSFFDVADEVAGVIPREFMEKIESARRAES
jgi:hypothetical protein